MSERQVALRLMEQLTEDGTVQIDYMDGELSNRTKLAEQALYDAMSVEACQVISLNKQGGNRGRFFLVFGNATDGSELIADYSDNSFCNRIYRTVYA